MRFLIRLLGPLPPQQNENESKTGSRVPAGAGIQNADALVRIGSRALAAMEFERSSIRR